MYFFTKKKKKEKRCACLLLTLLLSFVMLPFSVSGAEEPSLYATAAVLMDADTGRVLYGKNQDAFMANASTTKILTCILALENAAPEDLVEISAYAASMPKVKLYMKQGEHFKLGDLLYSLMLESHNDTAVAIAEYVGGSMEGFAAMMNEKAEQIGCTNTWFITPNGLDATQTITDENGNEIQLSHGTCAEDLARIMAYCTFFSPKAEAFLEITRTASYGFSNAEGRSFSCTNHNAFLGMMDGALSGKTGFTNKAGYCYVGALERDGKRFTIAILACGWPNNKTYKWSDSRKLFNYGIENFEYHSLNEASYDPDILLPLSVENGQTERIGGTAFTQLAVREGKNQYSSLEFLKKAAEEEKASGLLLSKDEKIEVFCQVEKSLLAPVAQGQVVGTICYMAGGKCLRTDEIITIDVIPEIDFFWCFYRVIEKFLFL